MNLKILKLNERHKKESKAAYDKFNKYCVWVFKIERYI